MTVKSSFGNYEIRFSRLAPALATLPSRCFIITDQNVRNALGDHLPGSAHIHAIEPGEQSKSIAAYEDCLLWLARSGARRDDTVVAFGGGVVGDLAAFVAATYMRGVGLIQTPTSLLAQVDSSVGGKAGIDLPEGKNLVGVFFAPSLVIVCPDALATLPEREFRCGAAEVLKYGFILDPVLANELAEQPLTSHSDHLERIIRRCIELKARVVEQDEFEKTGLRAILNFGHTVGHAIESVTQYGVFTHGEAISIGMVAEAYLGEELGITQSGTSAHVRQILEAHGLTTALPQDIETGALVSAMRLDKKAGAEGLAFSLLHALGECKLYRGIKEADAAAALEAFRKR